MASLSPSASPSTSSLSCSVCLMFSYSSASFNNNGTCNKCSLFAVLEARLSELESQLCTMEASSVASQAPLATAEPASLAAAITYNHLEFRPAYRAIKSTSNHGWILTSYY